MEKLDNSQKIVIGIIYASVLLYGLFYEAFAAFAGIAFAVLLAIRTKQNGMICIPRSIFLIALMIIPLWIIVSTPFAVDSGMNILGFARFLPVTVFVLLMAGESAEYRNRIIDRIPLIASIATAIGLLAYVTPLREYFFIQGRFSGTFQYANSYAIFLLIAITVLLYMNSRRIVIILEMVVLTAGLIATGSRSVFALYLAVLIIYLVKERKNIAGIVSSSSVTAAAFVLGLVTGKLKDVARFTDMDISSSSFAGRLLYDIDGLNICLHHPLGIGYKGFLFYQGAVQTGNYSVSYVHNDLLQTAVDFGIAAALILGTGFIIAAIKRGMPLRNRMIVIACGLHALVDWSFQFVLLIMILTLFIDSDCWVLELGGSKSRLIKGVNNALIVIASALMLWLGTASLFEFAGAYNVASSIYPGLTTSQMYVIQGVQDERRYTEAYRVCKRNSYCTIASQAMAEYYAYIGDFDTMTMYARQAVDAARYNAEGYEIYIDFLEYAADNCSRENQQKYLIKVAEVRDIIDEVENTTNRLAYNLYYSPEIVLDDKYISYIQEARK